jgi:hypothetical protein
MLLSAAALKVKTYSFYCVASVGSLDEVTYLSWLLAFGAQKLLASD